MIIGQKTYKAIYGKDEKGQRCYWIYRYNQEAEEWQKSGPPMYNREKAHQCATDLSRIALWTGKY